MFGPKYSKSAQEYTYYTRLNFVCVFRQKLSCAGQVMVKHVKSELYIVVGNVAMSYLMHGKMTSNSSLCTFVVEEGEDHPRAWDSY